MIYVCGDTHCPIDAAKFNTKNFPEQKTMTKKDVVIVCGDMGIVWDGSRSDKYWQDWFNDKNFTTVFVDGNHENHPMLGTYQVVDFCRGKAHQIADSVYHLIRGEMYNIEGKTFFCFGGANSHDKWQRTEGKDWWREEMPSYQEMEHGIATLERYHFKADYIITHDCPLEVKQQMLWYDAENDGLNSYFSFIAENVEFGHWYFGHYHRDEDIGPKYTCCYNYIRRIE